MEVFCLLCRCSSLSKDDVEAVSQKKGTPNCGNERLKKEPAHHGQTAERPRDTEMCRLKSRVNRRLRQVISIPESPWILAKSVELMT